MYFEVTYFEGNFLPKRSPAVPSERKYYIEYFKKPTAKEVEDFYYKTYKHLNTKLDTLKPFEIEEISKEAYDKVITSSKTNFDS